MLARLRLIGALAAACAGAGCRDQAPPPPAGAIASASAQAKAAAPGEKREEEIVAERANSAAAGLRAAGAASATHPAYLALRRAIAAGAPGWRRESGAWVEPLLGPPRSMNEAGGAMLLLDSALEQGDRAGAERQLVQIERALTVLKHAASRGRTSPAVASAALSDAAFDLGVIALEANAGAPAGGAAILADLQGTLDAVERGAAALASAPGKGVDANVLAGELAAVRAQIEPLRARLNGITSSNELVDRASFVMGTARLGVAVRRFAGALGASPKLPYRARVPVADNTASELISVLTVPAPRLPAPSSNPAASGGSAAPRGQAAPGAEAPDLADLGRRLFHDRRLSRGDVRSCATCHDPARGFADGLPTPRSLDPAVTLRHTPTLLYAPLHAAQMWDGRTLTPEQQALNVIHARAEMGLTAQELVEKLAVLPEYRGAIDPDPKGDGASAVARALVAFENERLVPADAPIDRFARGEEGALSADERAGLDVFAGVGRCTRCHVPPLFGGSRPRDFAVPVFAVLGVPTDEKGKTLDADRGRGAVTGRAADERSFKTPTARDVARTAPFFHHGRFATLEAVVDFYNRGGGRGLGLTVENQDPDVRPLKLTPEQTRALLVFMRTGLLDASLAEAPPASKARPKRAGATLP